MYDHHHSHEQQHHHNQGRRYTHPWAFLKQLENMGDEYLVRKAPWSLPHNRKVAISKLLPVLALIVAILSIPSIVSSVLYLLGLGGRFVGGYDRSYIMVLVQTAIGALVAALYFRAFDRLRKRQYAGRVYTFYAVLLSLVGNVLDGGVFWAIVSFLLTMYLLFQSKELYH